MANIFTKLRDYVDASLDSRINDLKKTDPAQGEELAKAIKSDGTWGRKGLMFDPFTDQSTSAGLFKPKTSFLSNHILKSVSRRDPIVAAIIDVRASQVASFCKKQTNRFDWGFKLVPKDRNSTIDPDILRKTEEFLLNTGYVDGRSPEDKMTLDQWGYMLAADFQRYGHIAIEKASRRDGNGLGAFPPLPAETIFYANKEAKGDLIQGMIDTYKKAADPNYKDGSTREDADEFTFLQVIEGKVVEGFTPKEIIFERINMESDIDLKGYAVGPLERAIAAITSHMQIENHQRQFFSHGMASKGVFVIQGDVTPNQLRVLQAQWNNQINGPLNAWRTPILAGIKGAEWISLTANNRDMEFAEYMRHVLVTVFSCMAMDPEEAGFGFLSKGTEQKSLSESSNEWKITASRDRGLRPILGRIEAIINEQILPEFNKEVSEKMFFRFVGLDAETPEEELNRIQAEVSLHTTLGEARKQAEMDPLDFGNGLILNPIYLQTVQANMPKGLFMEKFLGIPGASERPDLQYIPDPLWFQFQQMQMQLMQMASGGAPAPGEGGPDGQPQDGKGGGKRPPQKGGNKPPGNSGQQQSPEQQAEAMQAQMEAMQMAAEQYIAANPELFKSMNAELSKSEGVKRLRNEHVERLTNQMMKDFDWASKNLVKEILEITKEDLKDE